ncbi:ferredoxin [Pseudorhodoferax aquiterrae]|uniref:Ferredoxin n=1 Tax=Pseudorhodoferax aquiterrae TaxID=747304 RepID=A0ABQ3G6J3_9BURK|nr:(2Fe-2S)-binding protein [Pseudorhodoferax aquiterrae]GHC93497.1 ferredoxin [Pseudorhodoferax aquiterrae]
MTARVALWVDGQPFEVPAGISVAAALRHAGGGATRRSVAGTLRAPLCGMGVCQECRVAIDGRRRLACQTPVAAGMRIATGTAP